MTSFLIKYDGRRGVNLKWPDGKPYYSLNQYYKDIFGEKTYKIALDIGVTCPNRDGTLDSRGCLFCSSQGSGDFATLINAFSISPQIEHAISMVKSKSSNNRFVAYLQSYTNTYGDEAELLGIYESILAHPNICGLSIGTRPDCISDSLLYGIQLLKNNMHIGDKPIFIELGLQTIHDKTANTIRRCYPLSVFEATLVRLKSMDFNVIVHLIVGLPNETRNDFMETIDYIAKSKVDGVKLQLLHVLSDSDLGEAYQASPFDLLSLEDYCDWIIDAICHLPEDKVIHRITGDGNKETLLAPLWSLNKRKVLNTIHQSFARDNKWQGCHYK